jgi:hypothetical protein
MAQIERKAQVLHAGEARASASRLLDRCMRNNDGDDNASDTVESEAE